MERTLTRAERSELNRKKHALKRAKLEAQWAEEAQAKRDEKRRRREANRRAWWARYGMQAPARTDKATRSTGHTGSPCRAANRSTCRPQAMRSSW